MANLRIPIVRVIGLDEEFVDSPFEPARDALLLNRLEKCLDEALWKHCMLSTDGHTSDEANKIRLDIASNLRDAEAIIAKLEAIMKTSQPSIQRELVEIYAYLSNPWHPARTVSPAWVLRLETGQKGEVHENAQHFSCPFHDSAERGLLVFSELGKWYCHQCQRLGNALMLASELRSLSALQAIALLNWIAASEAGK